MSAAHLSPEQAKRFYDRIGRWQDAQALYEDRAVSELIAFAQFGKAKSVFEFGCGTGKFALQLLADHLPTEARYLGIDLSPVMIGLTRERLRPYGARAAARLADGSMQLPAPAGGFDRFVANYVLDLLSPGDIRELLREAWRVLEPGGLLCLASLAAGATGFPSLVTRVWERVWRLSPRLVGGCRPIDVSRYLDPGKWELRQHSLVTSWGVPSEVAVARRIG
jgi:ubiquinone/menaquinone biosynthesis C-methylase UbiE